MRTLIFIGMVGLSITSFARTAATGRYKLNLEIVVNGKVAAAPRFILVSHQSGRLMQGEPGSDSYLDLRIVPTPIGNGSDEKKIALLTQVHSESNGRIQDIKTRIVIDLNSGVLVSLTPGSKKTDFDILVGAEEL